VAALGSRTGEYRLRGGSAELFGLNPNTFASRMRSLRINRINANSQGHKGVWTLPPTLRERKVDRDKYLATGASDRMTLRFVKPIPLAAMR
jgi:hypothetical protein